MQRRSNKKQSKKTGTSPVDSTVEKRSVGLHRGRRPAQVTREVVLRHLRECAGPQKLERIIAALIPSGKKQNKSAKHELHVLVEEMVANGQLVMTRRDEYGLAAKMDLLVGRIVGHHDGFGFLSPDDGTEDLYISGREMRGLLHGDRIVARVGGIDRRGRRLGELVKVLERGNTQVVGRYFVESGVGFVVPDNKRIHQDVLVPREKTAGAVHGQIVVAAIEKQPDAHTQPIGRVSEILGEHLAPGMETDVAIRAFDLPHVWSEAALQATAAVSRKVLAKDRRGREDLRNLPLVTIDGADARDFDDAVYCERTDEGWRLTVAIADVSHYVRVDSALDAAARERGTSTYFANRVVPMLPAELSNGICSLNPEVDRLCLVCELEFDRDGTVRGYRFFEGVMRSAARLTYAEVGAMLVDDDTSLRKQYGGLVGHLEQLYHLYKKLKRQREKRGALALDTVQPRFVFDQDGKIAQIVPSQRNDAHRIIEECMIAANVAAAEYLHGADLTAIYRIHEPPVGEKVEDLRTFLGELGLRVPASAGLEPRELAALLKSIQGRADERLIQTVILRSLRLAVYSTDQLGHFGLALRHYAHFTSPIRRYPDLMVHRAIRWTMNKRGRPYSDDAEALRSLAEKCSILERRADDASHYAEAWLKCEYMLAKVGETFAGTVSAVTGFGLFVELDGMFIEGLVHVTTMLHDYYHFDSIHHRLTGERSGGSYRIGQQVKVRLTRVSLDERRIELELVERGSGKKSRKSRRRS